MDKLSIPEKISLEKEVAAGLRTKDLPKLLALAVPGVAVAVVVWIFSADDPLAQLISIIAAVAWCILCGAMVVRVDGSFSMLNYIELFIRSEKEQKQYYYQHKKEAIYLVEEDGTGPADGAGFY